MSIITLYRLYEEDGTVGAMVDRWGARICYTMENLWMNNQTGISCIPEGDYQVEYMKKSASGKYLDCYWVSGVPDRTGILIHSGNTEMDTRGCILPGTSVGSLRGYTAVLDSKGAMSRLHMEVNRAPFTLQVRNSLMVER